MMEIDALTPFYLGDWRVDPVLKQISRGAEPVRIDPRNMRVLLLLASRPGEVISQREIERVAWDGLVITPNSVYQSVAQLRRALDEDKSSRRYIETVSRRGYRLLAAITPCVPEPLTVPSITAGVPGVPATGPTGLSVPAEPSQHVWAFSMGLATLVAVSLGLLGQATQPRLALRSANATLTVASRPAPASPSPASALANIPAPLPDSYQGARNFRLSIEHLERSVATQSASAGEGDLSLLPALISLGNLYPLISDPRRCEQVTRRGLAILRKHGREPSTESVELHTTLAEALADTRRYTEAEKSLHLAMEQSLQVHGNRHWATVDITHQIALLRIAAGRPVEAEQQARQAIEDYRQVPDATTARAAFLRATLVWTLMEQARYPDAVAEGRLALDTIRADDAPAPYLVALTHRAFGEALVKAGRYAEAETTLRTVLRLFATFPHCPMDAARAQSALGEALLQAGRFDEAATLLNKAQQTLATGDGWRERASRRENNARIEQLHVARG